jgi:hypothetical protein
MIQQQLHISQKEEKNELSAWKWTSVIQTGTNNANISRIMLRTYTDNAEL